MMADDSPDASTRGGRKKPQFLLPPPKMTKGQSTPGEEPTFGSVVQSVEPLTKPLSFAEMLRPLIPIKTDQQNNQISQVSGNEEVTKCTSNQIQPQGDTPMLCSPERKYLGEHKLSFDADSFTLQECECNQNETGTDAKFSFHGLGDRQLKLGGGRLRANT